MSTIKKVSVNGQVYDLGGSGGGTIIETTYAELKSLKDSSALVPEQKYRITDYETMTKPDEDDYISANHGFDIVVTALAESKLKSNAEVLLRDGDLYFANSKLEEWSIKYSIDNDSELYPFCDPNGKGVIYKMVDENGNTAPFDFKNIMMKVQIVNRSAYPVPQYATGMSAGMDLKADIKEPVVLKPLQRQMIPTGLFIALPEGTEAQVRPRSGLAAKHGITVLNTPGTIDADYRGEIKVILVNLSDEPFTVNPGERIAQMVVARHERVQWDEVEVLDETERGEGGFGSTGRE